MRSRTALPRVYRGLRSRGRRKWVWIHPVRRLRVVPHAFMPDIEPSARDIAIAERILNAYEHAVKPSDDAENEDLWTGISRSQTEFSRVMETRDPKILAHYLCNMSRMDVTRGISQGDREFQHLKRSPLYRRRISLMAKDKLIALAEAVGAIAVENPEQGDFGVSVHLGISELARLISDQIGVEVIPPGIDGGLFKVGEGMIWFGERDCNAIYTAWLIHQTLRGREKRVCEIGGGTGRVAYWLNRMGDHQCVVYDLPQAGVAQGFYLIKALGDDAVSLQGEEDGAASVSLRPSTALKRENFSLVLNQDSFPEIHEEIVKDYLRWIAGVAPTFLSINHESRPRSSVPGVRQISVGDLVRDVGGLELESRSRYWLRNGYVVEAYRTAMA